jgi:hypothetical protein
MKVVNTLSFILASLFVFMFGYLSSRATRQQESRILELERQTDSLQLEIHTKDAIIGRYEMGLYHFAEQHPKEAQKYIKIILKETE